MPVPTAAASYDEVPYEGGIVAGSHPEHLAAIARLFGIDAAPAEACSVLEIGCAGAANLLPMAYGLPGSTFVGIDPAVRQIEIGRAAIEEYGVTNVELLACGVGDTLDWDRKFDYIVCHGVFSWVAPDVRDAILESCHRLLNPNGVALVSYNVLPGFYSRQAIGEMMRFHSWSFEEPAERAHQARALLKFLVDSTSKFEGTDKTFGAYHSFLEDEQNLLQDTANSYILHEHFSEYDEGFYLHEFVNMAGEHGLKYLGDAAFHTMLLNDLPTEVADNINQISGNQVALEQYRDFVVNRMFRKTLLCHEDLPVERKITSSAIRALTFRQRVAMSGANRGWRIVKTGGLKVEVSDTLVKDTLGAIQDAAPLALSFEELRARLRPAAGPEIDPERLSSVLLSLYSLDAVEFRTWTPPLFPSISERPAAFEPARRSANKPGISIPLVLHGTVDIDPFVEAMLPLVDGTRTQPELVEAVLSGIADGTFIVPDVDPEDMPGREDVERLVAQSLEELRVTGLLVS